MEQNGTVARLWHGWARGEAANAYEELLRTSILPGIRTCSGALVLRRDQGDGLVEFVTLTLWPSMEAVEAWAGDDAEVAVVPAEARKLLSHFDERSQHYRLVERIGP